MHALIKTAVLSVAVTAATLTSIVPASAGDYYRRHHHGRDAAILGAAGLATGLIVGSALASQPRYYDEGPVYVDPDYEPGPRYIDPPPPVYRPAPRYVVEEPVYAPPVRELRPWSASWRRYCSMRYRSFDPATGTYVGYDGRERFCTAG